MEQGTNNVYVVECNPRYTGAFPVYSMMQHLLGEVPLDTFQLLEFMNIDYDMDFDWVNKMWKQPKYGSHLVLHNPFKKDWVRAEGGLVSGVYRLDRSGVLEYVRAGATYESLLDDDEFVLTDGCPSPSSVSKPRLRVGKLIFRRGALAHPGELTDYVHSVVNRIMNDFSFVPLSESEQYALDVKYGYVSNESDVVDPIIQQTSLIEYSNAGVFSA